MPICHILVGPPGCGKSTFAERLENVVYVNQDSQGKTGHRALFSQALSENRDVVVDRMNFNRQQRSRYIHEARANGYVIHMYVFYVTRDACISRMRDRVDHPTIKDEETAAKALYGFFTNWEKPKPEEYDVLHERDLETDYILFKERCIIVDIDGTLANIDHRLHHVRGETKDWNKFFELIHHDTVNEWCRDIIRQYTPQNEVFPQTRVVLCSGRPEDYRWPTQQWLEENGVAWKISALVMRPKGDKRPDYIVKEMLLDFEILPRFKVVFAIDDRKQVVDMWRRRGIVCLQCDVGDF